MPLLPTRTHGDNMLMTIRKTEHGKTTVTTQEVDAVFKRNYCSADAQAFMRSLGGKEEVVQLGGVTHVYSTSPCDTVFKHVTFQ